MSMKYFYLILIFLVLYIVWQSIKFAMLKRFFHACVLKKALFIYSLKDKHNVFSSYIWLKVANLYSGVSRDKKEIFVKLLEDENFEQVINCVTAKSSGLSYAFRAMLGLKKSKFNLQQYVNKNQNDIDALLMLAMIYAEDFAYTKLEKILNKLKLLKLNKNEKCMVYILESKLYMHDTDMLSASRKAFKAIRFFKRNEFLYEEAQSYVLLGEIYRISAMYDVSQMMYEAAQKIYSALGNVIKVADVKTLKAILFMGQERFVEAKEVFDECKKIFQKNNLKKKYAEVLNQQALLYILQGKYSIALKNAKDAGKIHRQIKNKRGESFSLELASLVEYNKHHYKDALDFAVDAMSLYERSKNYAAYEDSAFVAAQSCFALKEYEKSEQFCRKILNVHSKHNTCFHVANVYSLLGLIYVKLNDFNRASALFKKSLNIEQCNERYSAVAIDYVNLALIDKKTGKLNSALHNFQSALSSAKKQNDEKLCAIIEQQIKKIKKF